jgi:hypothetical protein
LAAQWGPLGGPRETRLAARGVRLAAQNKKTQIPLKPAFNTNLEFDALSTRFQYDSYQDRKNPIAFKTSTRHKIPSKVPDDGLQFGKLAKKPCSATLYDLGNERGVC